MPQRQGVKAGECLFEGLIVAGQLVLPCDRSRKGSTQLTATGQQAVDHLF